MDGNSWQVLLALGLSSCADMGPLTYTEDPALSKVTPVHLKHVAPEDQGLGVHLFCLQGPGCEVHTVTPPWVQLCVLVSFLCCIFCWPHPCPLFHLDPAQRSSELLLTVAALHPG